MCVVVGADMHSLRAQFENELDTSYFCPKPVSQRSLANDILTESSLLHSEVNLSLYLRDKTVSILCTCCMIPGAMLQLAVYIKYVTDGRVPMLWSGIR